MSDAESEPLLLNQDASPLKKRSNNVLASATRNRFYIYIALIKLTHTFYIYLFDLPLVRLVERAVCQEYFRALPSGPDWRHVPETACKHSDIQNKVAYILGLRMSFNAIAGLTTSILYGALADKWGRRPVFALALVGEILALSWILIVCYSDLTLRIEFIWLEGLFYLIGGGTRLVYALIFTMVADFVPNSLRSRTMFLIHSVSHLVRIPALIVSSALMDNYLWLPFVLAFGSMAATMLCVAGIPETISQLSSAPILETNSVTISADFVSERPLSFPVAAEERIDNHRSSQGEQTTTMKKITILLRQPVLCIIFFTFLLKRIAFASVGESFIYQYASERFKMKLSQTFGVRLTEIIGALITTLVILPLITHLWHTGQTYSAKRDLWIARGSMVLLVGCFLSIFKATSIASIYAGMLLCGLGEGVEPALQALGPHIAGKALNAGFFTFITLIDTMAEFIGGPFHAALFAIRKTDGISAGYCFLASAIMFALLLVMTAGIKVSHVQPKSSSTRRSE